MQHGRLTHPHPPLKGTALRRFGHPLPCDFSRFFRTGTGLNIVAHDPKDASASPVESAPPISPVLTEDPAIDSLQDRLATARRAENARLAAENTPLQNNATRGATRIASTMIGYPVGGIVIGFLLDNAFGTLPWITIGLMFTAFVAACYQVLRTNQPAHRAG